jgi:hypothetical protein
MTTFRPARLVAAVALLGACTPVDDDYWVVDPPPHLSYDDTRDPRVEVPPTLDAQDAVPVPFEQIGEDDGQPGIVYSAALAGYYLMRIQDEEIGYHYQYDPESGEYEEDDNLHRKCGATFTQVWLYRFTRRPEFRMSTRAALQYMIGRGEWQGDGTFMLRDLGATALVTLSLTEYGRLAETDVWDAEINGLGEYLLARVQDDGSFSEGKSLQWAQAHQALWRLYAYTVDERYLEALQKVGRYFYDNRDDHDVLGSAYLYGLWANEPLTNLYSLRSEETWISEFVLEIGDEVAAEQYIPLDDDVPEEWIGGYWPNDGRGGQPIWDSTLKLEAVIDAFRMARLVDSEVHIDRFRKSALIGTQFLQGLQLRKGETEDFADEDFVVGGTPFALDDPTTRLDVPHHMANAILKTVEYMDLEDYPGEDED